MINKNRYLKVFSDCIPVKGFSRSCIYDLTRRKYYPVPNSLADILLEYDGKLISKIYEDFDNNPVLEEYFKFLTDREIIYEAEEQELSQLPALNMEWKHPSRIIYAVIDIDKETLFAADRLRYTFDQLGIQHLQIRLLDWMNIGFVKNLLEVFQNTRLRSIELIVPYRLDYEDILSQLRDCNHKILLVYVYEAPTVKVIAKPHIILTTDTAQALRMVKTASPKYFSVNIQFFTEAHHHHTFYNRKIFIDNKGVLRSSLFADYTFGHVDEVDAAAVIDSPDYQVWWHVRKDDTEVCRDCEFRYMCTDQRIPVKKGELWSHHDRCRYDPYKAEWSPIEGNNVNAVV
ncbi:MAG TPA: grasp-with-spasm system SPASM domain peptide maturase [Ohtaekwangia sp.]|uniref:grasp-with-spasm system SPASM domain peptide maturase n=1 Tax=Ohtaekwangia sp. TaxID=2066019 RepID=UPI002F927375